MNDLAKQISDKWEKFALYEGSELDPKVSDYISFFYKKDNRKTPLTILTGSPYGAQVACNYLSNPTKTRVLAKNDAFIASVIADVDRQLQEKNVNLPEGGL